MPAIGQQGRHPMRAPKPDATITWIVVDIGAAGAATIRTGSCPGWTCVRNTTGIYDLTFPQFHSNGAAGFIARVQKSAVPTVAMATPTALDAAAGTAQVKTALATPGTGVDPANGDVLFFALVGGASGVV